MYIHKTSNYKMGRKSFSMQKKRSLIKFMSIVLPDGYVLDTVGPYFSDGHNNDSGITWDILKEHGSKALVWLQSANCKNILVVDRGFRNVLGKLGDLKIEIDAKMPSIDSKKSKQSTTEQANNSRLVTKVRWVVESYHARFKKFENRQPTFHISILNNCLRVTSAALNAFRPNIYDTKSNESHHQIIANEMLKRSKETTNLVLLRVEKGELSSRGRKWEELKLSPPENEEEYPLHDPKNEAIGFLKLTEYHLEHIKLPKHIIMQKNNFLKMADSLFLFIIPRKISFGHACNHAIKMRRDTLFGYNSIKEMEMSKEK